MTTSIPFACSHWVDTGFITLVVKRGSCFPILQCLVPLHIYVAAQTSTDKILDSLLFAAILSANAGFKRRKEMTHSHR